MSEIPMQPWEIEEMANRAAENKELYRPSKPEVQKKNENNGNKKKKKSQADKDWEDFVLR